MALVFMLINLAVRFMMENHDLRLNNFQNGASCDSQVFAPETYPLRSKMGGNVEGRKNEKLTTGRKSEITEIFSVIPSVLSLTRAAETAAVWLFI